MFKSSELFRNPVMCRLMQCEEQVLTDQLTAIPGRYGLSIAGAGMLPAPASGHDWLHLAMYNDERVTGSLLANAAALPIADASMDVVLIRHATELSVSPLNLVAEAIRILSPSGNLLVTGMHPCSLWHPWLLRRARIQQSLFHPQSPFRWRCWLIGQGFQIDCVRRYGAMLPGPSRRHAMQAGLLAAAFLLRAHKQNLPAITVFGKGVSPVRAEIVGALLSARRLAG